MTGASIPCALGRLLPDENDAERISRLREIKEWAWTLHGILVVDVNDTGLSAFERALIRSLGDRLFGRTAK